MFEGILVQLIGGCLVSGGGVVGVEVLVQVQCLCVDVYLFGFCVVDGDIGVWVMDVEEVLLKCVMVVCSSCVIVVVIIEKFGVRGYWQIVSFDEIDDLVLIIIVFFVLVVCFCVVGIVVYFILF